MPRKARIDAPGALHHIIGRGIEKRPIFKDDTDRDRFLERLSAVLTDTGTPCYGWALIPNHFHLLLKTGTTPIATVMRRLLTGYAVYFNRRHRRHGQLFQNRYKSVLCQEDPYLLELVRYIHLNPLRAKQVEGLAALERFPYCGHGALLGRFSNDWQDRAYILRMFGKYEKKAISSYRQYVENGLRLGRRPDLTGGGMIRSHGGWDSVVQLRWENVRIKGDERILGDSDFVQTVIEKAEERLSARYRLQSEGVGLENVAQRVGEALGIPMAVVWEKSRRPVVAKARGLLAYWAYNDLGISMTEIGRRLGLTQPAVSKAVRRGAAIARKIAERMSR